MRWLAFQVVATAALCVVAPRAHADSSVKPPSGKRAGTMKPGDWRITWHSHSTIDHGNGVTRGHEEHTVEVSPAGTRSDTRIGPALPRARLDAIAALIPALFELRGSYQLSQFVNDEGSHDEDLVVTSGDRTVEIALVQGRGAPSPPDALKRAYELVVGTPMPSAAGH
jgi:hypothetical protein